MASNEKLAPCPVCKALPKMFGAFDMGYKIICRNGHPEASVSANEEAYAVEAWNIFAAQPVAVDGMPELKRYDFSGSEHTCDCGNSDYAIADERIDGDFVRYDAVTPLVAKLRAEIERLGEMLAKSISLNFDTRQERDTLRTTNAELVGLLRRWSALDGGAWHPARHEQDKAELQRDTDALLASTGVGDHG